MENDPVFLVFQLIQTWLSGVFGTIGITGASLIRWYPVDICRCPGWATMVQKVKTGFPVLGRPGSGFPDFFRDQRDPELKPVLLVPLSCL